jgi:pyroglutamyl-peptidase
MQTLITGFGPFGRVISNPTERLLAHFANEAVPGHTLTLHALPTSFTQAPQIMRALLEIGGFNGQPFDNVLMLGVATGSLTWLVEEQGRNHTEAAQPDIDGWQPEPGAILPDGPEVLPTRFPVAEAIAALERIGLPAKASSSAGAYVCNHLLYTTLVEQKRLGTPAKTGFLHVPADLETFGPGTSAPAFPFVQHVAAVRAVLSVLHPDI